MLLSGLFLLGQTLSPPSLQNSLTSSPPPSPSPCYNKLGPRFLNCQLTCATYVTPIKVYGDVTEAMRQCDQDENCNGLQPYPRCDSVRGYVLCFELTSAVTTNRDCAIQFVRPDRFSTSYILTRASLITACTSFGILALRSLFGRKTK